MWQTGIVHEWRPGQTRRLRTRLFQALELLRPLATIEIIEFRCCVRVMNGGEQMFRCHKLEEVENNTLSWTNAHRRYQHEFTKLRRVARRHLCRYPTTKRKAHRINRRKVLLEQ